MTADTRPTYYVDWDDAAMPGSVLRGPDGFENVLGEPEDRTWGRDGRNVVDKLNELHDAAVAARADADRACAAELDARAQNREMFDLLAHLRDRMGLPVRDAVGTIADIKQAFFDLERRVGELAKERDAAVEHRRATNAEIAQLHAMVKAKGFCVEDSVSLHVVRAGFVALAAEHRQAQAEIVKLRDERDRLETQNKTLLDELNTPQTADFFEAVRVEAAHQRLRWGTESDVGKTDADWFWLVGHLAGKAMHAAGAGRLRYRHKKRGTTYQVLATAEDENNRGAAVVVYQGEDDGKVWSRPAAQFYDGRFERIDAVPPKLLHHIISSAAALLNWHLARTGADSRMRPGIDVPVTPSE